MRLGPRQVSERLREFLYETRDARSLQSLAPLSGNFLPWTSSTMRPAAILAILNEIVINERRVVVECGSGNSTVFMARLFAQHQIDGHVQSIDHDRGWAALTAAALARDRLERFATVTYAPLVDGWYDRERLPTCEEIDLLVIDGPPAYARELARAREPALDAFWDRLAPDATIVLDDARRPAERNLIASWRRRWGVEFRHQPGGHAVARLTGSSASHARLSGDTGPDGAVTMR
jgi:SAM-dependent methyltransferase